MKEKACQRYKSVPKQEKQNKYHYGYKKYKNLPEHKKNKGC